MLEVVKGAKGGSGLVTRVKPKIIPARPKLPHISKERASLTKALHDAQHAFAVLQEACEAYNVSNGTSKGVLAQQHDLPSRHVCISIYGFNYCWSCHNFNADGIYINNGCEHCREDMK